MTTKTIAPETKELISKILAADVVRIDDKLYIIVNKEEDLDPTSSMRLEDFQTVFETDYHTFNWWEICNTSEKINKDVWNIGDCEVSFLALQPA